MKKNKKAFLTALCLALLFVFAPCAHDIYAASEIPAGQEDREEAGAEDFGMTPGASEEIPGASEAEKEIPGASEAEEEIPGASEAEKEIPGASEAEEGERPGREAGAGETAESAGIWQEASDFLRENLTPLLSAASLAAVAAATVFAKRGLMPRLSRAAASVLRSGQGLAEQVSRYEEEARGRLEKLEKRFEEAAASLPSPDLFREATQILESARVTAETARQRLTEALTGQSQLLYELLMSADLPQYEKERIGEEYNRIRRLTEGEERNA